MAEAAARRVCGDVLAIPLGMSGHVNPMMYVAKQLMERGVSFTMLLTEEDLPLMASHIDVKDDARFQLELVAKTKVKGGGKPGMFGIVHDLGRTFEPFLKRVLDAQRAGAEGPKCIFADQFEGWSQEWASQLQIPRYVSVASPATFGYVMYNLSANVAKGFGDGTKENPALDLSGIPPVRSADLPPSAGKAGSMLATNGDTFPAADGLLINTFYDLEAPAIDAFRAQIASSGRQKPKVLPIGPMLPPEFFSEGAYKGVTSDSECIRWLDTRPASSVVYIAFGSMANISAPQIMEIAKALEASSESFLWVLLLKGHRGKKMDDVTTLLPPGFQDRIKDRGFVFTEFAPQLEILSHPATGGFLTHCGWNSTLESICRGVPMIGWPLGAEQRLCCRVIVDQAKVATEVRRGLTGSSDLVASHEVVAALTLLMREKQGEELRERVKQLQSRARAAVLPGGSSMENFNMWVDTIKSRDSRIPQTQQL